jgi:chromosomal replication initiator protein
MYLSKELTKSSLKTIGLHFGGRDHSTVIHSCNSIEEAQLTDHTLKDLVDQLRMQIELNCS